MLTQHDKELLDMTALRALLTKEEGIKVQLLQGEIVSRGRGAGITENRP